ncbi:MAG: hypothetical protein WC510_00315 [Candidatus Omnitrophota bacterium]
MDCLLSINKVSGGYYQELIINDISLYINQGDFLGLSGQTAAVRLRFFAWRAGYCIL